MPVALDFRNVQRWAYLEVAQDAGWHQAYAQAFANQSQHGVEAADDKAGLELAALATVGSLHCSQDGRAFSQCDQRTVQYVFKCNRNGLTVKVCPAVDNPSLY